MLMTASTLHPMHSHHQFSFNIDLTAVQTGSPLNLVRYLIYEYVLKLGYVYTKFTDKESELFNYNTTMMAHIQMARYIVELDKTFVDHFTAKDFIQFQFIQVEHRGGFCNCWSISNLKVIDWAQSEFR